MKELIVILAKAMSNDDLVSMLEKSCAEFRSDPSDENFKALSLPCLLIGTRLTTAGQEPEVVIQEMNRLKKAKDLLTPNAQ